MVTQEIQVPMVLQELQELVVLAAMAVDLVEQEILRSHLVV
jgi:hypothetical protein